ncbi:cupredoxin domain-containing protein [Lacinutrix sp. MedPE-SW]|uniref:cupredoxin domain-containing protein n=1 Tax=Lacinutrix sp. MedPE-SW TaxID=1860087 RepID=UPI0009107823|nr:cupredoxin domain-containing protein [Lacinutrix sp. MedPE-SW]OIQ23651.1 MAG: hypothetical protein BM549_03545 [Lacinutrix sp. MedPE-SW]
MKKVVTILVFTIVAAFNVNAQDTMSNKQAVKTVNLEETAGAFTQKSLTLSEGTYVFKVTNNNASPEVGLVLIQDGKDGTNPENHIKEAYVSQLVKHGKTESSQPVTLTKGKYKYFCPYNNTPQYTLVVE